MGFSGPLYRQTTAEGSSLRIWFDHADRLNAKGELRGFEVAGHDQRFYPATARIEGNTVILNASEVAQPKLARYGWANATEATLYNGDGLPASTFTSQEQLASPCPAVYPGGCPR